MSSSTSSLSILTTLPLTMSPSSNSTMVASTASEKDCPPRSSKTTGASSAIARARRRRSGLQRCDAVRHRGCALRAAPPLPTRGRWRPRAPAASCSDNMTPYVKPLVPALGHANCSARERERRSSRREQPGQATCSRARRRPTSSSSGRSRSGGATCVVARRDAVDADHVDAGCRVASSSSSRAVKHVVQRSKARSSPLASRTVLTLVQHAGGRVERLAVLEEAQREVARRTRRARPRRRDGRRARSAREHVGLVAAARAARTRPGRGRSRRRTRRRTRDRGRRRRRTSPVGEALAPRRRPGPAPTKSADRSTPVHVEAAAGERERVPARAAPDVEHPHAPAPARARRRGTSTSCSVPLVNAFRRYAGPRNAAISLNQGRDRGRSEPGRSLVDPPRVSARVVRRRGARPRTRPGRT